jgi:hypothetical protein
MPRPGVNSPIEPRTERIVRPEVMASWLSRIRRWRRLVSSSAPLPSMASYWAMLSGRKTASWTTSAPAPAALRATAARLCHWAASAAVAVSGMPSAAAWRAALTTPAERSAPSPAMAAMIWAVSTMAADGVRLP